MSNGLLNQLQHRVSQVFYNPFESQSLKDCSLPYRIGKVAATAFASLTTGFLFLIALWALKRPPQNTQAPSGLDSNALPPPDSALPASGPGLNEQPPLATPSEESASDLPADSEQQQGPAASPLPRSASAEPFNPQEGSATVNRSDSNALPPPDSALPASVVGLTEQLPPATPSEESASDLPADSEQQQGPAASPPPRSASAVSFNPLNRITRSYSPEEQIDLVSLQAFLGDLNSSHDSSISPDSDDDRLSLVSSFIQAPALVARTAVRPVNASQANLLREVWEALDLPESPRTASYYSPDSLNDDQSVSYFTGELQQHSGSIIHRPSSARTASSCATDSNDDQSALAPTRERLVNSWVISRWEQNDESIISMWEPLEDDSDTDSVPSSKTTQARPIPAFQTSNRTIRASLSQAALAPKPSCFSRARARSAGGRISHGGFQPAAAVTLVNRASVHLTDAKSAHTVPGDSIILPNRRVTVTSQAAIDSANAESLTSTVAAVASSIPLSDPTLGLRGTDIEATQLDVTGGVVAVATLEDQPSGSTRSSSFIAELDSPIPDISSSGSSEASNPGPVLSSDPGPVLSSDPRAVLSTDEASQEAPPAQLSHLATAAAVYHTAAAVLPPPGSGLRPILGEEVETLMPNGPAGGPLVAPVATHPDVAKEPSARERVIGLLLNLAAPVRGASLDPDVGSFFTRLHAVSMRPVPSLAMPPQRKVPDMSKEEEEAMRRLFIGGDVVGFLEKESATSKRTSLDAIKLLESQIKTKERELRELKGKKPIERQTAEIESADSCIGAYRRSIEHHLSNIAHIDRAEAEAKRIKELMKNPKPAKPGEIESLMRNLSETALNWLANRRPLQKIIFELRSIFTNEEFQAIFGSDQLDLSEEPRLTLSKLFQLPVIPKLLRSILTDSRLKQEADSTGIELLGKLSNDILKVTRFLELAQNTLRGPSSSELFGYLISLKDHRSSGYDKPCICKEVLEDKYQGIIFSKVLYYALSTRNLARKLIGFIRDGIISKELVHYPLPLQTLIDEHAKRLVLQERRNREGCVVRFWALPGLAKPFSPDDIAPLDKETIINGFLELVFNLLKHCSESSLINNLIETILPEKFRSYLMLEDGSSAAAVSKPPKVKSLTIKDLISSPKARGLLAKVLPHLGLDEEIFNIIIKAMSIMPGIAACAKSEHLIEIFNKTYSIVGASAAKSISERDVFFNGPLFELYFMTVMKRKSPLVIEGFAGTVVKTLIG